MDILGFFIDLGILVIAIVALVKFLGLCADVKAIRTKVAPFQPGAMSDKQQAAVNAFMQSQNQQNRQ